MPRTAIDRPIINSPYEEPVRHWRYERETRTFDLAEGRRPAGYVVASPDSQAVRQENTERLTPVLDRDHPIRSTGQMRPWSTGKPCERTKKSHINVCVYDSAWEASDAFALEESEAVDAWVKNDHLGFEVLYIFRRGRQEIPARLSDSAAKRRHARPGN